MPNTICHASRHPSNLRELPDVIPGDLIVSGTGMTFYGGGLGISRLTLAAQVAREVDCGQYADSIAVTWRVRDARGQIIASSPHEWGKAGIAGPGTPA